MLVLCLYRMICVFLLYVSLVCVRTFVLLRVCTFGVLTLASVLCVCKGCESGSNAGASASRIATAARLYQSLKRLYDADGTIALPAKKWEHMSAHTLATLREELSIHRDVAIVFGENKANLCVPRFTRKQHPHPALAPSHAFAATPAALAAGAVASPYYTPVDYYSYAAAAYGGAQQAGGVAPAAAMAGAGGARQPTLFMVGNTLYSVAPYSVDAYGQPIALAQSAAGYPMYAYPSSYTQTRGQQRGGMATNRGRGRGAAVRRGGATTAGAPAAAATFVRPLQGTASANASAASVSALQQTIRQAGSKVAPGRGASITAAPAPGAAAAAVAGDAVPSIREVPVPLKQAMSKSAAMGSAGSGLSHVVDGPPVTIMPLLTATTPAATSAAASAGHSLGMRLLSTGSRGRRSCSADRKLV